MTKKIISLFLLMIIFAQLPSVYADETAADSEVLNNMVIEVVECSPKVEYGGQFSATIRLDNVLKPCTGTAQWHLDGVPLAPYYYSEFVFAEGATYNVVTPVSFSKNADKSVARLDMVIGNTLRSFEIDVPLEVYSEEFYDDLEKKEEALNTNRAYLEYIKFDEIYVPDILSYGETLEIEFEMRDVVEKRTGSAQWYLDGVALNHYYISSFECSEGKTHKFSYKFPFDKTTGNNAKISIDIVVGDYLRRIDFNVPLQVYSEEFYSAVSSALEAVKPVNVDATLRRDAYTYHDLKLKNKKELLPKGTHVYFKDSMDLSKTLSSALIKKENGESAYIDMSALSVSNKNYTVFTDHPAETKENFVNAMGYTSKTHYLVWINIERQKVNIFLGSGRGGDWKLIKEFSCATGANLTLTPEGAFEYQALGNSWLFPTYYVAPILYFDMYRGLAFHSRLYAYNGKLLDATIGTPASHGCIRMYDEDVLWMKQYIPFTTTIQVF